MLAAKADQESRYCYWGPAFRFDPENGRADEFDQAGLEWFAAPDAQASEAQVLALAVQAIEAAGVKDFTIRIGDLGLFSSLLDSIAMPGNRVPDGPLPLSSDHRPATAAASGTGLPISRVPCPRLRPRPAATLVSP